jgi:hypothetical protein
MKKGIIIGASIGNCVHVAGVPHFMNLAQDEGYDTVFLGPAIDAASMEKVIRHYSPRYVAVGYRLTPENFVKIIPSFMEMNSRLEKKPLWLFGGTPKVAQKAKNRILRCCI